MAKTARLELRVEPALMVRIDAVRGDVSRTRWVERAVEAALDRQEPPSVTPLPKIAPRRR